MNPIVNSKDDPTLCLKIAEAIARFNALTPKQQAEHLRAQRESYVRAEMSWPKAKFKIINGVKTYDSYEDYLND